MQHSHLIIHPPKNSWIWQIFSFYFELILVKNTFLLQDAVFQYEYHLLMIISSKLLQNSKLENFWVMHLHQLHQSRPPLCMTWRWTIAMYGWSFQHVWKPIAIHRQWQWLVLSSCGLLSMYKINYFYILYSLRAVELTIWIQYNLKTYHCIALLVSCFKVCIYDVFSSRHLIYKYISITLIQVSHYVPVLSQTI